MFTSLIRMLRSSWWRFISFLGDTFGFEVEDPIVFYYGCPNSKKAVKLQTEKRTIR
ncbi:MAG: hypothetical protein IJK60_10885 [Clostridia bacterium]|nr:hypothetical protein [Clostridia bacterium]